MRKGQLALGLFLLFFLVQFAIPTYTIPEVSSSLSTNVQSTKHRFVDSSYPTNILASLPTGEKAIPVPDVPLGVGQETIVEWWNTSYDFRRKITIIEPDIASRTLEPVHVYLMFSDNTARKNIIAVSYWNPSPAPNGTWYEVPSQIWNETTHNTGGIDYYDSCTVCFLLNISQYTQETFYIYYDDSIDSIRTYQDHITALPANGLVTDDSTMPWVYNSVTSTNYTSVDMIYIRSSASSAEHSAILLTDMVRQQSDWGGPCCGIVTARYGDDDAFDTSNGTNNGEHMLLGEFALDPLGVNPEMVSGDSHRANVAPDNPAEAWVEGAGVWILDDGPLFTRIKIVTSDGGYCNNGSPWCNETTDTVNRGTNGAAGFLNYTIIYTFYWHGDSLYSNIILDIQANPQWNDSRGQTQCHVKNYGDWPHVMTFTCNGTDNQQDALQNRKAWNGTLRGLYNDSADARRHDFPLESWVAWYDDSSQPDYDGNPDPSIGMIARSDPLGWELVSLAVTDIGDNLMLQQILREGHQGDFFIMPTGEHFVYDYTVFTTAYGTDFSSIRSQSHQINNPNELITGEQELFSHNILNCTTIDVASQNISNVSISVFNSTSHLVRSGTTSLATILFDKLEDDTYTIQSNYSLLSTYGGLVIFTVNTTQQTLNHTEKRGWDVIIECQLSYLTIEVRDWYDNSQLPTYSEVFLDQTSSGMPIFALNATPSASTYIFPDQYDVNVRYIDQFRIHNQTAPISVSGSSDTDVAIGIVAREHRTELELKAPTTVPFVEVSYNVSRTFIVFYKDLDSTPSGLGIDVGATSVPYIANWTLYNSTADIVDSGTLTPVSGEVGNFSMSFDASLYLVNETYQLRFFLDANAPVDYWQAFLSVSIVIRGREVDIVPSSRSYSIFWDDTFTFSVYLNDTAENKPITGAIPRYFGIGFSGEMLPNGTDGWYSDTLHVVNQSVGTYTITIRAQIAAYEDATSQILLLVAEQPTTATLINAQTSDQLGLVIHDLDPDEIWAPRGDFLIFTFNYTGYWNQTISNATGIISYQIGFQDITYIGNGVYQVTIDTNTLVIGSYSAAVGFSKQNFDVAIISFTIEIRNIPTEIHLLYPVLNTSYHEAYVGDILRIRVNFTDSWHNLAITDATVIIEGPTFGLAPTQMIHLGNGEYEIIGLPATFDGIFDLTITALADNCETGEFTLQLRVQTHPFTRQILTYGLIAAVIGIFLLIAWLAYARVFAIPWLVRKMRKMSTTLGKGKMPRLSGRDQRRIATRPNQMTDMMEEAYDGAKISFAISAVPIPISLDEREAEEVDIWHELDQLEGLGRDQKLELFEEMKRIPAKDRIWFLEDLKRQMADGTRFQRAQLTPPEGLLDRTAEEQIIQARLDAIPALSEREKRTLFKQITSLPPEEREEVFETLKEQYDIDNEADTS